MNRSELVAAVAEHTGHTQTAGWNRRQGGGNQ